MTEIPNLTLLKATSELQRDTLPQADCFGHWKLDITLRPGSGW